jgi:hypothetical protein
MFGRKTITDVKYRNSLYQMRKLRLLRGGADASHRLGCDLVHLADLTGRGDYPRIITRNNLIDFKSWQFPVMSAAYWNFIRTRYWYVKSACPGVSGPRIRTHFSSQELEAGEFPRRLHSRQSEICGLTMEASGIRASLGYAQSNSNYLPIQLTTPHP